MTSAVSSALVRQLSIKTSSVRRLRADEISYADELRQLSARLDVLLSEAAANGLSADELSERRRAVVKQREFIDECRATQSDINIRVDAAVSELSAFIANNSALSHTPEFRKAVAIIRRPMAVTVFGSSTAKENTEEWDFAYRLGSRLGERGYHVVNGGYGGSMESVSAGVRTINGATVEGVISPTTFPHRGPHGNRYLTAETPTETLLDRLTALVRRGDAFVVLSGSLGTLTELCLVWNIAAVSTINNAPPTTIVAVRHPWELLVSSLQSSIAIPQSFIDVIHFVDTVDQIVDVLERARDRINE